MYLLEKNAFGYLANLNASKRQRFNLETTNDNHFLTVLLVISQNVNIINN